MNGRAQAVLMTAGLLLLGALGWLWRSSAMELRWEAEPRISDAARENRMLAATLLLRQNGMSVTAAGSVAELPLRTIPDGTLIVGERGGVLTAERSAQLLAWVQRGNTLITQPRWINPVERAALKKANGESEEEEEEEEESEADDEEEGADEEAPEAVLADLVETDPLSARYGVRLFPAPKGSRCKVPPVLAELLAKKFTVEVLDSKGAPKICTGALTIPGTAYPLALGLGHTTLLSLPGAAIPLWGDDNGALNVYREGKGHVVMLSADLFNNGILRHHDHAELLVLLAGLNGASRHVTIVKNLDVMAWYQALWKHFHLALISLAAGIALLLWAGVRRFGPVLPEPDTERRSLVEHIDASGAWLWKADGGSQLLLDAAREDTLALIRRRAPALFRLPAHELPTALARATGQHASDVAEALQQDAARHAAHFTRQIRTLQELRTHYER